MPLRKLFLMSLNRTYYTIEHIRSGMFIDLIDEVPFKTLYPENASLYLEKKDALEDLQSIGDSPRKYRVVRVIIGSYVEEM